MIAVSPFSSHHFFSLTPLSRQNLIFFLSEPEHLETKTLVRGFHFLLAVSYGFIAPSVTCMLIMHLPTGTDHPFVKTFF